MSRARSPRHAPGDAPRDTPAQRTFAARPGRREARRRAGRPRAAALALAGLLAALPAGPTTKAAGAAAGLCGDARLRGRALDPIEAPGRCGVPEPVRVERADGVALLEPIVVNCRTARAFADWIARTRAHARRLGFDLAAVRPSGSYQCRPLYGRPGARLSEHAAGNAVDVAAFVLSDGRVISVRRHWGRGIAGRFLRGAWRAGCASFGTTLGPEHDAPHADHFHLDVRAHEGPPVCR
ncbi:extensin family protein [Oceanicella actignis]|uniref:Uncharacterized conserved protein n=1 Tax=Oceanicella actignis TaxID=1189325 RepID=A0A1M7SHK3_9RHOB|nr:extensin family protein [Oceanicella actignis]SET19160.1 Uncharacterized conserved protein [Oceanicella actignis]SHN57966.1 Uncharacterized conserved protein [Oceanicella actignis]